MKASGLCLAEGVCDEIISSFLLYCDLLRSAASHCFCSVIVTLLMRYCMQLYDPSLLLWLFIIGTCCGCSASCMMKQTQKYHSCLCGLALEWEFVIQSCLCFQQNPVSTQEACGCINQTGDKMMVRIINKHHHFELPEWAIPSPSVGRMWLLLQSSPLIILHMVNWFS